MKNTKKSKPKEKAIQTDVLIVGAGPTGLTTAMVLRSHGCNVTVIDKQAAGANTSRAAVIQSHTMETLEPYGVTDRLAATGIQSARFTFRDRDRVLVPVMFNTLPSKFPYVLFISQATTESILLERLRELGGRVLRPYELAAIKEHADGVTATLTDGNQIHAKFLVGADGLHSAVRQHVGIDFPAQTDALSFTLADVRATGGVLSDEGVIYFSGAGQLVIAPLEDGTFRIVAAVSDAPENPDVKFLQTLLDERGPKRHRAIVQDVVWGSRFRVHHGVASSFVHGRIALAGDAAHVHSPAGGQGMNLGIHDAVALGETLAAVLQDKPGAVLADYDTRQRPKAEHVVAFTELLTRIATVAGPLRWVRNATMLLLSPLIRRQMAWRLSQLSLRDKT